MLTNLMHAHTPSPQNKERFVDDSFPPSKRSLFYEPDDPTNHQVLP